jgi:hypothetical protein
MSILVISEFGSRGGPRGDVQRIAKPSLFEKSVSERISLRQPSGQVVTRWQKVGADMAGLRNTQASLLDKTSY